MESAGGRALGVAASGDEPGPGPRRVPPLELMIALPAVPASASIARDRVRRWLDELRWPRDEVDDVIMAANEAIANVIDHAYLGRAPGDVHVHGWQVDRPQGRRVVVTVTDRGRWRRFRADRGYRGHGVPMMVACMESVQIDHAEGGTTVIMASTTVAP
jgi:serine/threonine-protein kinase RsbW